MAQGAWLGPRRLDTPAGRGWATARLVRVRVRLGVRVRVGVGVRVRC